MNRPTRAIGKLLRYAIRPVAYLVDRIVDYRYGIDTSGVIALTKLRPQTASLTDCVWYQPTPFWVGRTALSRLPIDTARYTFVDYGSGKGRMLVLALEAGFRHVIGVEFSERLCHIARNNLDTFRARRNITATAHIATCDAREFRPPPDPTVIWMFTPFKGRAFREVVETLTGLRTKADVPTYLLYYGNRHECVFYLAHRGWSRLDTWRGFSLCDLTWYSGSLWHLNTQR